MEQPSEKVTLCADGKYRWHYALNMFTNPSVLLVVVKIFFWIFVAIFGVVFTMDMINWGWETARENLKVFGIVAAVFFGVVLLGYLIVAAMYHGKYEVIFEMDENGLVHRQVDAQFKKAQKLGALTALAGAASGHPGRVGTGMMAASKSASISTFAKVRRVKAYRWRNLIKVSEPFSKNQVYCRKEDFDFVLGFIRDHCPKVQGGIASARRI